MKLTGKKVGLPGIPLSELSRDQKGQVRKTMNDLLSMFREKDAKEAIQDIQNPNNIIDETSQKVIDNIPENIMLEHAYSYWKFVVSARGVDLSLN